MGIKNPGLGWKFLIIMQKTGLRKKNLVKVKTYKTTNIRRILKINQRSDK